MITRMIFEWTFGYHVMFLILHNTLQNQVCIGILLSHHHAHYTVAPITDFVRLSRHPHDVVTCVWPDDDGYCHTKRALT